MHKLIYHLTEEGHCCPQLFQHTIVWLLVLRWKRGRELVHCLYKKLQKSWNFCLDTLQISDPRRPGQRARVRSWQAPASSSHEHQLSSSFSHRRSKAFWSGSSANRHFMVTMSTLSRPAREWAAVELAPRARCESSRRGNTSGAGEEHWSSSWNKKKEKEQKRWSEIPLWVSSDRSGDWSALSCRQKMRRVNPDRNPCVQGSIRSLGFNFTDWFAPFFSVRILTRKVASAEPLYYDFQSEIKNSVITYFVLGYM